MVDVRLALMAGSDIPIPECQITLHQPSIKEISFLGETDFFIGVQCLCLHKSMFVEDKAALSDINNFQIFMTMMMDASTADKKVCVQQLLNLLFPKYKVLMTPRSILFQGDGDSQVVDESNFETLQDVVRQVFCANTGPMDQQAFNPANDAAREIAQKLMRGRQRVAAQRDGGSQSSFSRYLSILTIGLDSMSLHDLVNCTMYQMYDLLERYMLYINWDLNIRTRLAGGKPDSQPEDWMKNIH
jgi:hypothetical protein